MAILDGGPIYTSTGEVLQIQYAQKRADTGNTCIALKSKHGLVMIKEKPIDNNLFITESDNKILKITDEIYQMASGIETDLKYVNSQLKRELIKWKHTNEESISPEILRKYLSYNVYQHTSYFNYRVFGVNIISCIKFENEFKILTTTCDGHSLFHKASAIGKGSRLAKTEIEKLELDDMNVHDLVENGIRILYKSFDSVKDKPFDIEIGVFTPENNFIRLKKEDYKELVDKYKDFSVDGEE
ncbi:Proteasome subunit alpha type-3 [Nosema bombycis CQ1]|uniref:Proteasome subunit alpha type-3 n=1 Tax=Nosema bombycis (strain CQ1 / CVCC 102059) TaxID=578461 RepID=R0MM77_NOSB1|nr:Proteasome subunit alpha type-3 [Nosema bombycis CQ1]|eukprot:EOB13928.1 Proteasome subunit alpha type-3 [Nosema bombycis CQ1]